MPPPTVVGREHRVFVIRPSVVCCSLTPIPYDAIVFVLSGWLSMKLGTHVRRVSVGINNRNKALNS